MGDIGKAKHAAKSKQVRGKHAKPASTDIIVHPARIRYAAGTFLVSSAIALGLFALQPVDASKSIDLEESQTAWASQNALVIKNVRAIHSNIEESIQSDSTVHVQSTAESIGHEDSSVGLGENAHEDQAAEDCVQTDSSRDGETTEHDVSGISNIEDDSSIVPDSGNSSDSEESSGASIDKPVEASHVEPNSESPLNTESDDVPSIDTSSPASMISGKVSNLDTDTLEGDIAFFCGVLENGKPIAEDKAQELAEEPVYYTSVVEPQLQYGVLDSGCEIVSLSMALESMGIKADPVEIAEGYLDLEGGMTDGFVGSPYEGGAGFPAGITKAANAYLQDIKSERRAYDLTGNSFDTIAGLVSRGYPVLTWTTIDFTAPFFHDVFEGDYQWYGNEHCVLLCGISDNTVLVCDPLEGLVERDAEQFIEIFEQCGSMALYVR